MYNEIFDDVKKYLADNDGEATKIAYFPFRKRSEHIWRVFQWAKRLIDGNAFDVAIDTDSVMIAALFHDVGYALSLDGSQHADNSAIVFNKYASEKNMDCKKQEFISYLISNHSKKSLLNVEGTPLELIILMEADILDETGALSIVWDCMMEGGQPEQSFVKTYKHIETYSYKALENNPMQTKKAKEFWAKKQDLMREFLKQLAFDLAINES
jgi:uncharacterized protein